MPGRVNYLLGGDPAGWRTDIPTYRTVTQHDVWPGIDLVYYGDAQHKIESDFVVAPGADPRSIRLAIAGGDNLSLDRDGNLQISAGRRAVTMLKPLIYQRVDGRKEVVDGRYVIDEANAAARDGKRVRFEIASYDRHQTLVIDPELTVIYSTFLGGSDFDEARAIAVETERAGECGVLTVPAPGAAFVTGYTRSPNFPVTQGALGDSTDAFVAKFSADGESLIYSTFIGGTGGKGSTEAYAIALDCGFAYITGVADTKDFPTTQHAFQSDAPDGGGHPFVSELTRNGQSFVFSTYVGSNDVRKCNSGDPGVDWGTGIDVGATGLWVTGITCSEHFPVRTPFQTSDEVDYPTGFIFELNRTGSHLLFSTYLGGNGYTQSNAIALNRHFVVPHVFVTGSTDARNFPTKNAFQSHRHGPSDAFVTEFEESPASTRPTLAYSTYLGGGGEDEGRGIAVDSGGHAYVVGNYNSFNFPITHSLTPHGEDIPGMFIAKFSHDGSALLYCDALGGFGDQSANSIAVFNGSAYITGWTDARDFPVVYPFQGLVQGGRDAFVSKISKDGNSLLYSTYLGGSSNDEGMGIAVGLGGDAYVAGATASGNFPTNHAFQSDLDGSRDAFVTRLHLSQANPIQTATPPLNGGAGPE